MLNNIINFFSSIGGSHKQSDASNQAGAANGKIDCSFSQNNVADCALLSTALSLANTKEGAQAIEDALCVVEDDAGDVVEYQVTFSGLEEGAETYTITPEELKDAKTSNTRRYSVGDDDMTILELAFEKCFAKSTDDTMRSLVDDYASRPAGDMLYGVNPASVTYALLGETSEAYKKFPEGKLCGNFTPVSTIDATDMNGNNVVFEKDATYTLATTTSKDRIVAINNETNQQVSIPYDEFVSDVFDVNSANSSEAIKDILDNYNSADKDSMLVFAVMGGTKAASAANSNENMRVTVDGENGSVELVSPHAYSVKNVSNGYVTLVDPHDTSQSIKVKEDSLFGIEQFYLYELNTKFTTDAK